MNELELFIKRLKKIGINIEIVTNYPWIYIYKINEKTVKEKFMANHGFTIAFMPIHKEQKLKLTDTKEIFKLIRKYL
jgi:hypothetical protein